MKVLILGFAILVSATAIASAVEANRNLRDLVRTGSIVHPQGILAGR